MEQANLFFHDFNDALQIVEIVFHDFSQNAKIRLFFFSQEHFEKHLRIPEKWYSTFFEKDLMEFGSIGGNGPTQV